VKVEVSTVLAAPPETVWSVIEPIETHTEWMADAVRITFTTERRRGVGTAFDCLTRVGPFRTVDRMVVTEWEPGRAMGIEHRGLFRGAGRFTLDPVGHGGEATLFTWTEHVVFPWWLGGPAGALVATPVLRRIWRENLDRLAVLVASGA
jgi:uncharacterized protein YndB with AHSA1/START domain